MYKEIKVGDKQVPMLANAATPIRFKQVFGKNLLKYFIGEEPQEEMVAMASELAYILAKAGESADMNKLGIDDYIEWLEQFDAMAFVNIDVVSEIMSLYQGSMDGDSQAKKGQGRPKGK